MKRSYLRLSVLAPVAGWLAGWGVFSAQSTQGGLVHRWNFNEVSGTNFTDSAGLVPAKLMIQPGGGGYTMNGQSIRLDGGVQTSADYVSIPGSVFGGLDNGTIEIWAEPHAFLSWSRVIDIGSGDLIPNPTTNNVRLSWCNGTDGNSQRFGLRPYPAADSALPTSTNVVYHYAIVWSANGGAGGQARLDWYRNGSYVTGQDVGTNLIGQIAGYPGAAIWLARTPFSSDQTGNASYHEMRIHDHAMNAAEVAQSFNNGPDIIIPAVPQVVDDLMTLNAAANVLIPVLANDTGAAPVPATLEITSGPAHGSALVKPGGKVLYTHDGSPTVADAFTYRVQGTAGATSEVATVSLTITNGLRLANTTMMLPPTPPPVTYTVEDTFPGLFFEDALAIATPPGRTNQIFVVERRGRISYVPDIRAASPTRQVFLDFTNQVSFDNTSQGERGLLGLAFHPNFESNGYFYVYYVAPAASGYTNRLSRFQANPVTLTVNTNTQQPFFDVLDQDFNHNGGDLHFGPDGFLYIGMGDEGSQQNARQNAQRIDKDLYSSLLRIDVDRASGIEPTGSANTTRIYTDGLGKSFYTIPADNPFLNATNFNGSITNVYGGFFNTNTVRTEIFATGFRHIWRFSIDAPTGDIWVGDVGQYTWEEIDVVTNGGNYGWGYYEATHLAKSLYPSEPNLFNNPPPGLSPPVYEYRHANTGGGNPSYEGDSVTGGVVYRGVNMPELYGAYLFADFEFQHIWALRRTGTNVSVERLAGKLGIAAFGVDPGNGDILLANYLDNQIQRLVRTEVGGSTFPQTLSDTGVFADLATLAPNPGIVHYEPKVAFWSDHSIKNRWFSIPDLTNTVDFAQDSNWSLPAGMKWIKHFDLELERGNPATRKRIETRILSRTDAGVYGISYKWNDDGTEAFLVPDAGDTFHLTVTNAGIPTDQFYEIPSRSGCLACHTSAGGYALTFNTREMNHDASLNGFGGNEIDTLAAAGYFGGPVPPSGTLPRHAQAGDTNASLEFRVRSYFAVNCSQCHQTGGTGGGVWDGRAHLTLQQTALINGPLDIAGTDPLNRLIVPGDKLHSVVWLRMQGTNNFGRMPPIGSHVLDETAIALVGNWIDGLTNRFYDQFQITHWGATNNPAGLPGANGDGDKAGNYYEFLTGTDPTLFGDEWKLHVTASNGLAQVSYDQVPNLGVVIETAGALGATWQTWNVPGNALWFPASSGQRILTSPMATGPTNQYFRARLIEP